MTTVGVVSPGHMGAGLGWALREGGARVLATVSGRSARTRRLAEQAGLELLPALADVVASAEVVLSVTPPGRATAAAQQIDAALTRTGASPVVADLNAVSPTTMAAIAATLAPHRVADGAISGPPPTTKPGARLFLSGAHAHVIAALPWAGKITPVVVGQELGAASATKMCTAGVYKGLTALITQALRTAAAHDVLDEVVRDLAGNGLTPDSVVSSATKADRFADEMREIAATQQAAGLTPALFLALAEVYENIATTGLAQGDPESSSNDLPPADMVRRLRP